MKKILFRSAVLALLLALSVFIIALADNVQGDDLESGGNTTKEPGETGTASFWLVSNGPDGCNVDASNTATATVVSNQSWLTIDIPGTVTITGCGAENSKTIGYSVSLLAPIDGVAIISVSGVTGGISGNNGWNLNPSTFEVTVIASTSTDTDAPVIDCDVPDQTIWYGDNVTVSCIAYDDGSGLANSADASFSLSTNVAVSVETNSASTDSREVCDNEGNCSTAGPYTFMVDRKAPVITCDSPAPTFLLNEADAWVTATATDSGSGPESQNVSAAADTSSVLGNPQSVDVSAEDNVGNSNTESCTYSVIYDFDGFFQPIDVDKLNKAKAGSAIPVKFSLNGDQGLSIFAAGFPTSNPTTCGVGTVDTIESTVTAGQSSLSYDPVADQYVYVWKTDKAWAGKCLQLTVKLNDDKTYTANFTFTK